MNTIAHISDLHFGREDLNVAEGLVEDLQRLKPSLIINSGDFTQRARRKQFQDAADYMKRLSFPQLNVPGNHDIPLYDVFRRFRSPLDRYREYITEDLIPIHKVDGLLVFGINTARSFTWKNGRISEEQIQEMDRKLSDLPESVFKVVVTHHPFIPPPGQKGARIALVGRASKALEVIEKNGVDLLLSGHLHHGYTGDIRTYYPSTERSIIVAQAGTAISNRRRFEPNGYNFIRIKMGRMEIEVRRWSNQEFREAGKAVFVLKEGRWIPQSKDNIADRIS